MPTEVKPKRKRNMFMQKVYHETYYSKSEGLDIYSKNEWSEEDTTLIMSADRPDDLTLAEMLGRSIRAIETRRSRHGGTFNKSHSGGKFVQRVDCDVRFDHESERCNECIENESEKSLQCRGII